MRTNIAWIASTSLLVLACGNEVGSSPDDTGTTDPGTSTNNPTTADTTDPTANPDTSDSGTSTAVEGSSSDTGEPIGCGNDVIDDGETCDGTDVGAEDCASQGFDGGVLGCAADCSGFDTSTCTMASCGNNTIDGREACDGTDLGGATCASEGFDSGTLACDANCGALDTSGCASCGNGMLDGSEVCDGNAVDGQSCVSQGFDSGALSCAATCDAFNTSNCGTCGNDVIDGTEFCDNANVAGAVCQDYGYDSGTIGCAGNCTGFDFNGCGTCGNGIVDGDEFCDGFSVGAATCESIGLGFDSGTLACADAEGCGDYDTSGCGTCGNGIVDGDESCDGADLGGSTCESLGLTGGELGCSASCSIDVSNCDIPGIPFGSDVGYNGYYFSPPSLPCDDISGTGTETGLGDDQAIAVPVGFDFPMYGVDFNTVGVSSNGNLHFGDASNSSLGNACVPSNVNPITSNIFTFWDDLNSGGAGVRYQTLGADGDHRFIVQWDTSHYSGDLLDQIRIQVMLMESTGQIIVCYPDTLSAGNIGDNGAEATSGIQLDGATGFQFSCNTPDLVSGLQLLYIPA